MVSFCVKNNIQSSCTQKLLTKNFFEFLWNAQLCLLFMNMSSYWWISRLHLMCAIARAHASTRTTSSMRVKNSMCHLCLWLLLPGTLEQRNERKNKNNRFNSYHFSLIFPFHFQVFLMFSFMYDFRIRENS